MLKKGQKMSKEYKQKNIISREHGCNCYVSLKSESIDSEDFGHCNLEGLLKEMGLEPEE